ncbi:MAG: alpha-glucan family phosphorylase [Verrucomicrobia bacterium]|nr:alpha-glucan family phosphorylase [Verrucomicrobiota bacterium]
MMTESRRKAPLPAVAYYCMEFGLDPAMKTYSGGLGILAGDYLKGAFDGGYPITGIGIRLHHGYVDQEVDGQGNINQAYQQYNHDFLHDTGVRITVPVGGVPVVCKVWQCTAFQNATLYLLDTFLPENGEQAHITDKLYGGDSRHRIAQELVLGIGGFLAIEALELAIDIHHFNEGHAVFAGLEMLRRHLSDGKTFPQAVEAVRQRVVFTTHTPVKAGNEEHELATLDELGVLDGLTKDQAIQLGGTPFNMTAAALRLSRKANAVAELHGDVATDMWSHLDNVPPITPITNAIHQPTWVDPRILDAAGSANGLWGIHQSNKVDLLRFVAERTGIHLDPETLLIAFSRRAAVYKRWDLIFGDEDVVGPLLKTRRLQLVFSGKSHPNDSHGQAMIQRILGMTKKYPQSVVFLPNYDMTIGRALTRGADVWLNCPRRPNEASGTSGMKAAMNGVLNLSTLDGWWPEACDHGVNGWQYGDGKVMDSASEQDLHDRDQLYRVLTTSVLPTYYERREDWVTMMRASISSTRSAFHMERMLADYYATLYTL